jgi:hypothetical protein
MFSWKCGCNSNNLNFVFKLTSTSVESNQNIFHYYWNVVIPDEWRTHLWTSEVWKCNFFFVWNNCSIKAMIFLTFYLFRKIEFISFSGNVIVSPTRHSSLIGSSDINTNVNDFSALLGSQNRTAMRTWTRISKIHYIIISIFSILVTMCSFVILLRVLFKTTNYSSPFFTTKVYTTSTGGATVVLSQGTITTGKLPMIDKQFWHYIFSIKPKLWVFLRVYQFVCEYDVLIKLRKLFALITEEEKTNQG